MVAQVEVRVTWYDVDEFGGRVERASETVLTTTVDPRTVPCTVADWMLAETRRVRRAVDRHPNRVRVIVERATVEQTADRRLTDEEWTATRDDIQGRVDNYVEDLICEVGDTLAVRE